MLNNSKIIDVNPEKGKGGKIAAIVAICVIVFILIGNCVAIVPAGCTGVKTTFGKVNEKGLEEGFHLKVPIAQDVIIISNKIQVYSADASSVSKDLQSINAKVAVNYRVNSGSSASVYKNIGEDYQTVLLMPNVQESMKSVCAKYTAEQLISLRAQVGDEIKDELTAKLSSYGIQIEKFNMVNFEFSKEFDKAIEEKQVAEQNLIKTKTEQEQALIIAKTEAEKQVISAEADAKAIKARAEAQAEANRIINESLNTNLINYEMIKKWDGVLPKVSSSANPLISLDLNDTAVTQ
jgi:regulator of protease activity HflC (stomatin/prohibitin superfamily)